MSGREPPSGYPVQLIGYSWHAGHLELAWRLWPADSAVRRFPPASMAEPERWPLSRGARIALSVGARGMTGERRCIGYRPPAGGPPRACPDWRALPPGSHAQCADCERAEGRLEIVASDGSRPPTGPRAEHLRSAHEVYLAAFAADVLKVGVSVAGRTEIRLLEQGAPVGLVVGSAGDGMAARRLEHVMGLAGARERVQVRTKLRLLYPPPDADALLGTLRTALDRLTAQLGGEWPPDVERLEPPRALDNTPRLGLAALEAAPNAAPGPPAGTIRGQVVAAAGALLVVREAQASLWGEAAPIMPAAHDLRAWVGWRVAITP
jgi:hypothetical protein